METRTIFFIGGTGFIGAEAVREAIARGWKVKALARSEAKAERLRSLGAVPVRGDAGSPETWIAEVCGAEALVDLVQPGLPARIGRPDIERISRERQAMTRGLLASLRRLAPEERPLLVSVSGLDDLAPDAGGRVDESSPPRSRPTGFAHVGLPVRRMIESDGAAAAFVYLGTVYGPGKSFAESVFPRLARGRMFVPCSAENRLPLIHVRDAGRAIVHLVGLGRERLVRRNWILVDEAGGSTLSEFFSHAAECIGVAPPRRAPAPLLSMMMGTIVFQTLSRHLEVRPSELLSTGFRFVYPTIRHGLPATLSELGYDTRKSQALEEGPPASEPARRPSRARRVWLLLAVTAAALFTVNALDLPLTVPRMRKIAGGESILDLRFGYTPVAAYQLLDALGQAGRGAYLEMLWTVDLLLPILFTAFLWTALDAGALRRLRWAALLAGAADYLENVTITVLLLAYPGRIEGAASLASAFTVSKTLLYYGCIALAIAGARRTRAAVAVAGGSLAPTAPARRSR